MEAFSILDRKITMLTCLNVSVKLQSYNFRFELLFLFHFVFVSIYLCFSSSLFVDLLILCSQFQLHYCVSLVSLRSSYCLLSRRNLGHSRRTCMYNLAELHLGPPRLPSTDHDFCRHSILRTCRDQTTSANATSTVHIAQNEHSLKSLLGSRSQ